MARILVQTDDEKTVLLDERSVRPEHITDAHSAVQLMERLEWAVGDEDRRVKPRGLRRTLQRRLREPDPDSSAARP